MTKEQLASEKTVLQKNLLFYEGLHGRPVGVLHTHTHTCPEKLSSCTQCSDKSLPYRWPEKNAWL